uniref:ATP-dependent RNA helicase n=1 Tax=Strigamia maritima TaxID=126957 RepID=T1IJQ6_STRMM
MGLIILNHRWRDRFTIFGACSSLFPIPVQNKMDDSSDIVLNLSSGPIFKLNKTDGKKKIIPPTIKKSQTQNESAQSQCSTRGTFKPKFVKNKRPSETNIDGKDKLIKRPRFQQQGVISSLFKNNPRIPDIPRISSNRQATEELFVLESFDKLKIHPYIATHLKTNFDVTKMTYVQKASIPYLLDRNDALIKSQTGSGKTLAYAVPVLHSLQEIEPKIDRKSGTFALVILPTRELAIQSYECISKLSSAFLRIVPGCIIGGEKKKSEKSRIRKGVNILVATPGRLIDHLDSTVNLTLNRVRWLIIDEADRLLDLGYEKDLTYIISKLHEQVEGHLQTVMLSATLTSGIEELAGLALKNPQIIDAASITTEPGLGSMVIPSSLQQFHMIIPPKLRLVTLAAFILLKSKYSAEGKIIVFFPTQDMVDFHAPLLHKMLNKSSLNDATEDLEDNLSDKDDPIDVSRLHGNMTQQDRTQVFRQFKATVSGVLLSTDVAARGLDLPAVDWIIQYSAPPRPEDYVHRVGRTSRIGHVGHAVLFLLPTEIAYLKVLEENNIRDQKATTVEEAATQLQLGFESAVLSSDDLKSKARKAYLSYVRAYATYPKSVRNIFNFKEIHLGHLAKSFALRQTPSQIGGMRERVPREFNFKNSRKWWEDERLMRQSGFPPGDTKPFFIGQIIEILNMQIQIISVKIRLYNTSFCNGT